MIEINLLPWRVAKRIRQSQQIGLYSFIALLLLASVIFYIKHNANQAILIQSLRNIELENKLKQLKTSYQKQISIKSQSRAALYKNSQAELVELPLQTEMIQINYAKASDLALILKEKDNVFMSDRGLITVDPRTNMIMVQDTSKHLQMIKSVLKQFDIPNRQVLIEARLVNMTKDCALDLGVRFGLLRNTEPINDLSNGNSTGRTSDHLNIDLAAIPLEANPASMGIALATLGKNVLLDLELSALESEGRAEIIASPRLLTTNQEEAIIESGEDIPYQEYTASGATSVSFKKAVLSLKVIPQITSDGKLMMALSINQDSDSGRRVQGVPIILTKSIETNVLVNNGQTIVLGGIYRQDKNNSVARVPFLGTLPIVGNLFARKQVRMRNEELLIFITPRIISIKR